MYALKNNVFLIYKQANVNLNEVNVELFKKFEIFSTFVFVSGYFHEWYSVLIRFKQGLPLIVSSHLKIVGTGFFLFYG